VASPLALSTIHFEEQAVSVLFAAGKGLKRLDGAVNYDLDEGDGDDIITVPAWTDLPYLTEGLEVGATYKCSEQCWFSFGRRLFFYEQLARLADFANYEKRPPGADQTGRFGSSSKEAIFLGRSSRQNLPPISLTGNRLRGRGACLMSRSTSTTINGGKCSSSQQMMGRCGFGRPE
jgi:hypothetical protein